MKVGVFLSGRKGGSFEFQQFKELHWWLGAYMHTHTSICIHVAIQFKETGRLLDLHKAMFMVTVAASHTHI